MSKKLLKRPTFLEDNANPSMINDFQQEMIGKRGKSQFSRELLEDKARQ